MLLAAVAGGQQVLVRMFTGDSYHYLTIARKAHLFGLYTYDGVHVTNGFHPLMAIHDSRALLFASPANPLR